MLRIHAGAVAATVSLPRGFDERAPRSGDWSASRNILLFGSSDLLRIYSHRYSFESPPSDVGRTINWYHAADLGPLHVPAADGIFRAFSFFRLQRPEYAHLTLADLERTLARFTELSRDFGVGCRVLLGLGWADLYLDLTADAAADLFRAIGAYRAVVLDERAALFRNAFTVFGVDLEQVTRAQVSPQIVQPTLSLRVAPSKLAEVVRSYLPPLFPEDEWTIQITTGKRDVVISPLRGIPFATFWESHRQLRKKLGTSNPIYKVETHFDFSTDIIADSQPHNISSGCACADVSAQKTTVFMDSVARCGKDIGPGMKQSLNGLAQLYREALHDRDSCCDFDAAAAHYYAQHVVIDEYRQLAEQNDGGRLGRGGLLREAIERLDVSASLIFNQEQNGSYIDLLSRSERVALYRGGMQKLTSVLLLAMDALIQRHDLRITPMLCWWPAGQIQSERPISVIKVPVYYLNEPEVALFLIIHELGQLTAYQSGLRLPLPNGLPISAREEDGRIQGVITEADVGSASGMGITVQLGETIDLPSVSPGNEVHATMRDFLADREADTGKLLTDIFADAFLLRVGFNDELSRFAEFLLSQFSKLEDVLAVSSDSYKQAVHLFTRLTYAVIVTDRLRQPDGGRDPVSVADVEEKSAMVLAYLEGPGKQILALDSEAGRILRNSSVVEKATSQAALWRRWVDVVIKKVIGYEREPSSRAQTPAAPGELVSVEAGQVVAHFRDLLRREEREAETLFLRRTALMGSVLASVRPARRL